jgi:glucokinase
VSVVGIDVGGTSVKGVQLDERGTVVHETLAPTSADDANSLVRTIVELARELRGNAAGAVGVAVAAFLDRDRTIVQFAPNIALANRSLKQELENILQVPVLIENDANAAAVAEHYLGAGRGASPLVMFTLGTGVGGAIVHEGRLLIGHHGVAGELCHLIVPGGERECGCGQRGCLETVASGTAIVQEVRQLAGMPGATSDEATALLAADPGLQQVVLGGVANALADAISLLQPVLDPQVVIFGGGVIDRAGTVLLPLIEQAVRERVASRHFPVRPELRLAELGNRAGAIGAALLAAESVDHPH